MLSKHLVKGRGSPLGVSLSSKQHLAKSYNIVNCHNGGDATSI